MVFDKAAATLLHPIILPVPDARTKGVDLTPAIFGNPLVGLTAEETPGRNLSTTTPDIQRQLINRAAEILPALVDMPITATYAGLRPATGFIRSVRPMTAAATSLRRAQPWTRPSPAATRT